MANLLASNMLASEGLLVDVDGDVDVDVDADCVYENRFKVPAVKR